MIISIDLEGGLGFFVRAEKRKGSQVRIVDSRSLGKMDKSCIGRLPDKEEWKEQPERCQDTVLLVKLLTDDYSQ